MAAKGNAGSFIQGFMGSYNAERDRREKNAKTTHQEAMDKSQKEYRDVLMAGEKTRQAQEKEDRLKQGSELEAMYQRNPVLFKHYLETAKEDMPEEGFMAGDRLNEPGTIEGARQTVADKTSRDTASTLAASRDKTASAAMINARTNEQRADNEALRIKINTEQLEKSRQTMVAITQTEFPGTYAAMREANINIDDLNQDGLALIYSNLKAEISDSTLTMEQLQSKREALVKILGANVSKSNALFGSTTPPQGDARTSIDVNDQNLKDTITASLKVIDDAMAVKQANAQSILTAPQQARPNQYMDIPAADPNKGMPNYIPQPGQTEAQNLQANPYGSFGPSDGNMGAYPGVPIAPAGRQTMDVGDDPSSY